MKTRKFYSFILKLLILAVLYPGILCSAGKNHINNYDCRINNNEFVLSESFLALSNTQGVCDITKKLFSLKAGVCLTAPKPPVMLAGPFLFYSIRKTSAGSLNLYEEPLQAYKPNTPYRSIITKLIVTPGRLFDYFELPELFNEDYFKFHDDNFIFDEIIIEKAENIQEQESQNAAITGEDKDKSPIIAFIKPPAQETEVSQDYEIIAEDPLNTDSEENTLVPSDETTTGNLSLQEDVLPPNDVSFTDPEFSNAVRDIAEKAASISKIKNPAGVYVKELSTGYEFGINENLTVFDEYDGNTDGYFRAASVVKLQMAYVAYRLIEKGELSVDKVYYDSVTNKEFMLLPTLHKMVSQSDNNLFNTMLRLIGCEKTNKILIEYGILNSPVYGEISPAVGYSRENNIIRHGTTKVGGKITPKDMGRILEAIYNEKGENPYMECFNKALIANIYNNRIPEGIGHKYPVAHKTGTADSAGAYNDAGIIYCKNPYILVVLTKGEASYNAQKYIRELAKELTSFMDERPTENK